MFIVLVAGIPTWCSTDVYPVIDDLQKDKSVVNRQKDLPVFENSD